jgi:hypothetical protein
MRVLFTINIYSNLPISKENPIKNCEFTEVTLWLDLRNTRIEFVHTPKKPWYDHNKTIAVVELSDTTNMRSRPELKAIFVYLK